MSSIRPRRAPHGPARRALCSASATARPGGAGGLNDSAAAVRAGTEAEQRRRAGSYRLTVESWVVCSTPTFRRRIGRAVLPREMHGDAPYISGSTYIWGSGLASPSTEGSPLVLPARIKTACTLLYAGTGAGRSGPAGQARDTSWAPQQSPRPAGQGSTRLRLHRRSLTSNL